MTASDPSPADLSALPILAHREAILEAIAHHPVTIVAGDTGCGKTTQIPRFCLESGRGGRRWIGCTQPRRLAAVSVAERVAQELGEAPGVTVGWQHRFGRCLAPRTRIKFMTDGILLAETRGDPALRRYDTLMIDEAHERSLNIDFLLGYLRLLLPRRPDLKVIVSSATLDVARFQEFFGGAPVVSVPGRRYPVEIRYRPPADAEDDLPGAVADAVAELAAERPGDILVFLPGERDIRAAAEALRGRALPDTELLPLLASLPPAEQRRAFRTLPGRRRVILATNVAETSLTIPGIRMVVDSGLARISRFQARTQVQRLHIEPISQASAEQRAGRCGRLGPGVCVRLYAQEDLRRREEFTDPEIRRTSLGSVILSMAELGLGKIAEFPFLEPPAATAVREGYRELAELQALDDAGRPTALGRRLARLPVEPRHGRMLLAAEDAQALPDALTVVAGLSCDEPRLRPLDRQEDADKAHAPFRAETSDFAGMLRLWRWFHDATRGASRGAVRRLCTERLLSFRKMEEWIDVRGQLADAARAIGLHPEREGGGEAGLHRALLTGLLSRIGQRDPEKGDYRGARGLRFALHPGSGLFRKPPAWLVAAELVDTTRLYARRAAAIAPQWIEPAARHLCKYSHHSPFWDPAAGTARVLERVTLHGLVLADGRRRDLSRIDHATARDLFIRHGLVAGALPPPVPEVVRENLALLERLRDIGRKTRGQHAIGEDAFHAAWERALPPEIANLPGLRAWIARADPAAVARLRLDPSQFAAASAPPQLYPDHAELAGWRLPLTYRYAAGADDDGITCHVPVAVIPWLRFWPVDWLVPGALPEKVRWMLAALPKPWPRGMPPAARAVPAVLARLGTPGATLARALARALKAEFGTETSVPEDWCEARLPPHLRLRFRVCEDDGREVFVARDPDEVAEFHRELAALSRHGPAAARPRDGGMPWPERQGLTSWDFEKLPERVSLGQAGWPLMAYPALDDRGDAVDLRLFVDAQEAERRHVGGVRRLYARALGRELATLAGTGTVPRDVQAAYVALGGDPATLKSDAALAALDTVLLPPGTPPPRSAEDFAARLAGRRDALAAAARERWQLAQAALVRAAELERELGVARLPTDLDEDLHEQLAWLVFPGFVRHVAPESLQHYGRYLEGLARRIARARDNTERERLRMRRVQPFWRRYRDAAESAPDAACVPAALERYRWAVEEFRVSVHAQELGTPQPVSAQRLEILWSEVKRG